MVRNAQKNQTLKPTDRIEKIDDLGAGRSHYQRDYTAIIYSHAFRRLRHKTQVFFFTDNDHVSTRLDHSLYVSTISEIVCIGMFKKGFEDIDPNLARTIGIGHDLGHAPFGHAGEEVLNELAKDIGGFEHEKHSLRIVEKIDKPRDQKPVIGLNLTLAVRDGIVNHCGEDKSTKIIPNKVYNLDGKTNPWTTEGCIVKIVDKIAYLGRDLEDAIIYGMIDEDDIPGRIQAMIGSKNGEIVDYFVSDLIENSNLNCIKLSKRADKLMNKLIEFNYERIYNNENLDNFNKRVNDVLALLFERFFKVINEYHDQYLKYKSDDLKVNEVFGKFINDRKVLYFDEESQEYDQTKLYQRIVIDFLSTLTDNFVFQACSEYFLPKTIF